MSNQNFLFHPVSFPSNPFSSFNLSHPSNVGVSASPQPLMDAHSHPHPSLSASPTHSRVHDYSDSLSVSHSSIPFPSVHQITANEFGGDTLEVEDTHQFNHQHHLPNPFNAFSAFTGGIHASTANSFSSSFGSSSTSVPQASSASSSNPFTCFGQNSSNSSPFTQSDSSNNPFNVSQLSSNVFKHFSSPTSSSTASLSSTDATKSPSHSTFSSSSSTSSSKDGVSFYNIPIPAEVLARRPALAKLLGKRRLDCLENPVLLEALQHTKIARIDASGAPKPEATTNEEDKNSHRGKEEAHMQEEVKKLSPEPFSSTLDTPPTSSSSSTAPAALSASASASSATATPSINRRRQRSEEMDTSVPSANRSNLGSHPIFAVKRSRNTDESSGPKLDGAGRRRGREADAPNPFPAHDYTETGSALMDFPRAKKLNTSGEPVYTLAQLKKLIIAALKNQEEQLREEYRLVLHELMADQAECFKTFIKDSVNKPNTKEDTFQSYCS